MIKPLVFGIGACLIAVGSSFLGFFLSVGGGSSLFNRPVSAAPVHRVKLKPISVPIFRNGDIRGYVVAELSFIGVKAVFDKLEVKPEVFAYDSLFSVVVESKGLDFASSLSGEVLTVIRKEVMSRVNRGVGVDAVQEVVFESFAFVPFGGVRGRMKGGASSR